MMNRIAISCIGLLAAGLFSSGSLVHAAADPSAAGLYSAVQAKRGAELYHSQGCEMCHGADLAGPLAPLTGNTFLAKYTDQSILELFDKVQKTMPQTNPGSLTPAQTADLLAYILSMNKYPAGNEELPVDREKLKALQVPKLAK